MASGTLAFNNGNITFSLNGEDVAAEAAFVFSPAVTGSQTVEDAYRETYLPVVDDGTVSVKLSYGYDELSYDEWAMKSSALVIPAIGTTGMADTSYIPIRMRLTWKVAPSIFTIRDYFIDVSYVSETAI
jgi:hypothetical protein